MCKHYFFCFKLRLLLTSAHVSKWCKACFTSWLSASGQDILIATTRDYAPFSPLDVTQAQWAGLSFINKRGNTVQKSSLKCRQNNGVRFLTDKYIMSTFTSLCLACFHILCKQCNLISIVHADMGYPTSRLVPIRTFIFTRHHGLHTQIWTVFWSSTLHW